MTVESRALAMLKALEALVARVVNEQLARQRKHPASTYISVETVCREVLASPQCPRRVSELPKDLERLALAELRKRGLSSRKRYDELAAAEPHSALPHSHDH